MKLSRKFYKDSRVFHIIYILLNYLKIGFLLLFNFYLFFYFIITIYTIKATNSKIYERFHGFYNYKL